MNNLIEILLRNIPVKSLTLDNDLSFQKHEELSELIKATIFFVTLIVLNKKAQWKTETKAIRRYLPKKCDLSKYSEEYIQEIQRKLRMRYMKCLDYKTPEEAFNIEMEKLKLKNNRDVI